MRLGDLDALTEDVLKSFAKSDRARDVIKHIQFAPTIDAVPVVRCKDCKHYWKNVDAYGYSGKCVRVCDNDFCSYGERKDGEG